MPREMKETGIEWIGEVPKDWDIVRIAKLATIKTGNTPTGDVFSDDNGIDWIKTNNLLEEKGTSKSLLKIKNEFISNSVIADKGSTLVSCIGDIGKMAYLRYSVSYNQQINSVKFKNIIDEKFGFYSLYSQKEQHKSLSNGNVLKILNSYKHGLVKITFPNIKEQKKIADLLDKKCQEIEEIKETIEAEIKTLDEYKKSIITEAVTKGLDKGAEMKDSGIEWIGQIPKHWSLSKIKFIADIFGRIGYRGYTRQDIVDEGDGAVSLSPSNMIEGKVYVDKCTYISWEKYEESPEIKIYDNDILMVKTGSSYGKVALAENLDVKATINPQLIVLKSKIKNYKYLYYTMSSKLFEHQTEMTVTGGTIPTMSQEKIAEFYTILPPINEQNAIAEYLDHKTSAINEAIDGKRAQLVALDEYKKSLIYEYVTGKKEA